MAAIPLEKTIFYPESDGKPMAETGLHLDEMVYVLLSLKRRFLADPNVFVGANMFLYFRKGDPKAVVAPDAFVVKGVPKRLPGGRKRRKYLLWEEGQAPCFVLETTSASTRREDRDKREVYEQLGVDEYFQFDPEGDYLKPQLQGLRLLSGRYREVRPEPDGSLVSQATGIVFRAEGCELRLLDASTGAPLLRDEEQEAELRQSEAKAAAAEKARRRAERKAAAEEEARLKAEARVRELEEELAKRARP